MIVVISDVRRHIRAFTICCAIALQLSFFIVPVSMADFYIWTDENGQKHFSDRKPVEDVEVKKVVTKQRQSAKNTSGKNDQVGKFDSTQECGNSLRACESQYRDEYSYRLRLCKGDWSAAAAVGNTLYGGSRTGSSLLKNCKDEARTLRDERLKSCSTTFRSCLKK